MWAWFPAEWPLTLRIVVSVCFYVVAPLVGQYLPCFRDRLYRIYRKPSNIMEYIVSWGGVLFFVFLAVWLFIDTEKARPICGPVFIGGFFFLLTCWLLTLSYKCVVKFLEDIKKLKEEKGFRVSLFQVVIDIIGFYLLTSFAGGLLLGMLTWCFK